MKKIIVLGLSVLLCFSVAGCGGSQEETEKVTVPDSAEELFQSGDVYFELDDNNKLTFYFTSDELEIADCFYIVSYAAFELGENDVEYQLSIVLPDGTYDLDLEAKEISESGFPDKWNKFFEESGISNGTNAIQEMISKSTADDIENGIDEKIIDRLAKPETETQTPNIIAEKEYMIDGEKLTMRIVEKDGEIMVAALGNAKTEEKGSLMLATFLSTFKKSEIPNFYVSVNVGDLLVSYVPSENGYSVAGKNKDGSIAFSTPDWITSNWTMQEEEIISFSDEILEDMVDFMESTNQ